jgi:hypothetical protein
MILKQLTKYQPLNLVIYIILGIILWSKIIFNGNILGYYIDNDPMPVFTWMVNLFGSLNLQFVFKIVALILILLQGLLFNGIVNQYNFIGYRSYLPGIIYLLIVANFPAVQVLHPIHFATLILIFSWNRITNVDFGLNNFSAYFNAALLLGISTLFYPNFIYLILLILVSTSLNRVPNIREFIMIILGFSAVWYFYFSLFYIFTDQANFSGLEYSLIFKTSELLEFKVCQTIFIIYLALLLILASIKSTGSISSQKIQIRRNHKIILIWFIIGLAIYLFTSSKSELIYLLAIPVSFILSSLFFDDKYKWLKEIGFILFLSVTFINQFFPNLL